MHRFTTKAPARGTEYPMDGELWERLRVRLSRQFVGYVENDADLVASVRQIAEDAETLADELKRAERLGADWRSLAEHYSTLISRARVQGYLL